MCGSILFYVVSVLELTDYAGMLYTSKRLAVLQHLSVRRALLLAGTLPCRATSFSEYGRGAEHYYITEMCCLCVHVILLG